jgi:hypothetical protein
MLATFEHGQILFFANEVAEQYPSIIYLAV